MALCTALTLAAAIAGFARGANAQAQEIAANTAYFTYTPASGSWDTIGAPGSYMGDSQFCLSNANECAFVFKFPEASSSFQFWGYQRSNGGRYSISIDGQSQGTINYNNASSNGNDGPVLLYSKSGLSQAVHTVKITNILDPTTNSYGQANVDHFVINGPKIVPHATAPTFPANGFLAIEPMQFSYHVNLVLGAQSPLNGGSKAVKNDVLFDAGATGAWVVWIGCTESQCQGHNDYYPSKTSQHFYNTSKTDIAVYGNGGPANTLGSWRVNDTLTFGNVTIPSTTFGATYELPSGGEGLDGNFGMARGYCNGALCSNYPGFVETMYEAGIIKAPVISFYQLAPSDSVPSGVVSQVAVGGVDRDKYTGSMDWIPLTTDSMWISPGNQRYVNAGNGAATKDLTSKFVHTQLTFDTGDPGLLGLPHDDWVTLTQQLGGKNNSGTVTFPCDSTMTFNFHGTVGRNYTFALADKTTNDGSGFCNPLANDAGDTTNWITGVPFFDHYYTSWYYGNKGIGSTLGFGIKNLGASAANSAVVVGKA